MYSDSDEEEGEEGSHVALGDYQGERNDEGQRHGYGAATLPNGDKYEGYYAYGKRHGEGIYL